MVFLIIAMCLITEPKTCIEVDPYEAVTPSACAMFGELGAVEYLRDHPKWRLLGWRCRGRPTEKGL